MRRMPGCTGLDSFIATRTPGPLGCQDAGGLNVFHILGDTPGPSGLNDWVGPDADARYGLGIPNLHATISRDQYLLLWDYDPERLLEDERLNPEFVELAHRALSLAVNFGLRPKVHEAYRSPQESDRKYAKWKSGRGGRAAAGWHSAHNYGLAMDVWLYDNRNRHVEPPAKGWYILYKLLAKACSRFLWGEPFDDADHFEYHPNWPKPAKGKFLDGVRNWAMSAAVANGQLVQYDALTPEGSRGGSSAESDFISESEINWLPYFWWAAGVKGGNAPPNNYTASNKPPTQS